MRNEQFLARLDMQIEAFGAYLNGCTAWIQRAPLNIVFENRQPMRAIEPLCIRVHGKGYPVHGIPFGHHVFPNRGEVRRLGRKRQENSRDEQEADCRSRSAHSKNLGFPVDGLALGIDWK
jgi:hypothetical protein